jgi:hypothetical protein
VSDQDFFFDEEPEAKAPETKGSKSPAPGAAKPPRKTTQPEAPKTESAPPAGPVDQSTTWAVAALLGVAGLLLGAILGFLLGSTLSGSSSTTPTSLAPTTPSTQQAAPQLTTEQIQAGQLPAGHPKIGSTSTPTTTAP